MKSWIRMVICFIGLWGFIKFSPVLLYKIGYYKDIIENAEKLGVDNAAMFYTEDPVTSFAEQRIKEKLKK